MQNFSATHLIPAVEMEVREAKRKAKHGESVRVLSGPFSTQLSNCLVRVISEVYGAVRVKSFNGTEYNIRHEHYTVMEPTGVMVIDGIRYVTEDSYKKLEQEKDAAVKEAYEAGKTVKSVLEVPIKKNTKEQNNKIRRETITEAVEDTHALINAYTNIRGRKFIFNCNTDTGIVTCTVTERNGKLVNTGTAKCSPDDQFDYNLGKVIAIRRALKLDVPEKYIYAPPFSEPPTEQFAETTTGRFRL